ncbi:hypothetical protein HanRHA438_Chr12g0551751 [Helianthus annuus]|nr:hypothetical protein HanRHA438_Chr12g0551751 [Helianthus annuus]
MAAPPLIGKEVPARGHRKCPDHPKQNIDPIIWAGAEKLHKGVKVKLLLKVMTLTFHIYGLSY